MNRVLNEPLNKPECLNDIYSFNQIDIVHIYNTSIKSLKKIELIYEQTHNIQVDS